jgi:hypothetical protein
MPISFTRSRVAGLAVLVAASVAIVPVLAAPAAQAGTAESVVSISNCKIKQERSKTYTWASCTIKTLAPDGQDVSVKYSSSMKTFIPKTGGTWSKQTGTLKLQGSEYQAIKLAFKGKTPAQVRKSLKVTLSNAKGATIGDATAVVAN